MRRMLSTFLGGMLVCWAAQGQVLRDPTRLPETVAVVPSGEMAGSKAFRLEAVLRSGSGTVALIAGERVRQGEKIREWRVLAIRENEVVLADDDGNRELLRLTPMVEKKVMSPKSGSSKAKISGSGS